MATTIAKFMRIDERGYFARSIQWQFPIDVPEGSLKHAIGAGNNLQDNDYHDMACDSWKGNNEQRMMYNCQILDHSQYA